MGDCNYGITQKKNASRRKSLLLSLIRIGSMIYNYPDDSEHVYLCQNVAEAEDVLRLRKTSKGERNTAGFREKWFGSLGKMTSKMTP